MSILNNVSNYKVTQIILKLHEIISWLLSESGLWISNRYPKSLDSWLFVLVLRWQVPSTVNTLKCSQKSNIKLSLVYNGTF